MKMAARLTINQSNLKNDTAIKKESYVQTYNYNSDLFCSGAIGSGEESHRF